MLVGRTNSPGAKGTPAQDLIPLWAKLIQKKKFPTTETWAKVTEIGLDDDCVWNL